MPRITRKHSYAEGTRAYGEHVKEDFDQIINLVNGALDVANLAALAVATAAIQAGAVTTSKLNDLAVTEPKISNSAVSAAKIEPEAVTPAKLQKAVGFVQVAICGYTGDGTEPRDIGAEITGVNWTPDLAILWRRSDISPVRFKSAFDGEYTKAATGAYELQEIIALQGGGVRLGSDLPVVNANGVNYVLVLLRLIA